MAEIKSLGRVDKSIFELEYGKMQTDEVVVTNERRAHIKEKHPEDYYMFEKYGHESVTTPDLIIKDMKHCGTVFMIKKFPKTNLLVVVRVVMKTEDSKLKNSVMTSYRIRDKNLKKLIKVFLESGLMHCKCCTQVI